MPLPRYNHTKILSLLSYLSVYVAVTVFITLLFAAQFERAADIDWLLIGLYGSLSLMAFTYFFINDRLAKRYQGRFMALGFLLFYLGWLSLVMSMLFVLPQKLVMYVAGMMFVTGYVFGTLGFSHWSEKYYKDRQQLKKQALTDELTQLNNRRALAEDALKEQEFALSSNSHLSLLIVDLDDFKRINDQLGHAVGDLILEQLSKKLAKHIRETDKIYRWGGEEFVVLLPVTALFEAHQLANKMIRKVSEYGFNVGTEKPVRLTVSIGVAQWLSNEGMLKETFKRADEALYQAKNEGKNSAVAADFKNVRVIR